MPQPLNRIIRDAKFTPDANALEDKPQLAKLVASIFGHWGLIEQSISLLLVRVLGADAEPAIAMFSTLTAQHLQLGALEAAARAALTTHEFDVFRSVISVTDVVQKPRNQLAHWVWGKCPQLPDALLLAEPKARKEQDRRVLLAWRHADNGDPLPEDIQQLYDYDPSTVTVYRLDDLERAKRDISDGAQVAYMLVEYLNDYNSGRIKANPNQASPEQNRKLLMLMLNRKRLFREAWDRIAKI
jgi:hypothetical protein